MSEPGPLIEAPLINSIAAFDGRVLEVFLPYTDASMRYHAALIHRCWIDDGVLKILLDRNDQGMWPFAQDQGPVVEQLVAAVESARLAYTAGAPGTREP